MTYTATDTDILIVGAGPVGLFLANECARRGLRWRIVETRASQSEHSKALAIFPRTMEIFDMAGLVGPFLDAANRVTSVTVEASGHRLAHMRFVPEETPYPFVAMVPQNVTERLLAEHLQRAGGVIEYETTFVSAAEQDECVNVTLGRRGEPLQLRAAFVVGCDGARSTVRHLLNLPFEERNTRSRSCSPTSRRMTRYPRTRCSCVRMSRDQWRFSLSARPDGGSWR